MPGHTDWPRPGFLSKGRQISRRQICFQPGKFLRNVFKICLDHDAVIGRSGVESGASLALVPRTPAGWLLASRSTGAAHFITADAQRNDGHRLAFWMLVLVRGVGPQAERASKACSGRGCGIKKSRQQRFRRSARYSALRESPGVGEIDHRSPPFNCAVMSAPNPEERGELAQSPARTGTGNVLTSMAGPAFSKFQFQYPRIVRCYPL